MVSDMGENLFELMQKQKQENEIRAIISANNKTEQFGLSLTVEEARELVLCRNNSLKETQRLELGESILEQIIFTFCDSQYIEQERYAVTLMELQDVFFQFKNEAEDNLTDAELMTFMREVFEDVCMGDVGYLAGTCLERFAEAIRTGYEGYKTTDGKNEYSGFDEENRWDKDLYLEIVRELFW